MESFAGANLPKRETRWAVSRNGQPPSQFRFSDDAPTVYRVLSKLPSGTKIAGQGNRLMAVVCRENKGDGTRHTGEPMMRLQNLERLPPFFLSCGTGSTDPVLNLQQSSLVGIGMSFAEDT